MRRIEYNAGDFVGDNGLIFIEEVEPHVQPSGQKKRKASFLCICGKAFSAFVSSVSGNNAKSCGCVNSETARERCSRLTGSDSARWRGGVSGHYLYATWEGMLQRCYNENYTHFDRYGGRGIKVFEPWHDSKVFLEFCDTVLGERPEGYTLDRIDNDGNYEPSNVRWASKETQANNRGISK